MLAINITKTEKAYLYLISIVTGLLLLIYTPKQNPTGIIPNYTLIEQNSGEIVTNDSFKTKPSIIHFWASWCATCLPELVKYAEIQKLYPEDLYVLAVNRRGNAKLSNIFSESLGISGDMNFLIDNEDVLYRSVKGRKMPLTLFVNSSGAYSIIEGSASKQEIENHITKMIATK